MKNVSLIAAMVLIISTAPASARKDVPEAVDLGNGLALVPDTVREGGEESSATIDLTVPKMEGTGGYIVDRFNNEVGLLLEGLRKEFRPAFLDDEPLIRGAPGFLDVTYEVTKADSDAISVLFKIHWYYSGAAHPNYSTSVLNFDMRTARALDLADLFLPGTDYLVVLSDYCIADLKERDAILWNDGALPARANFRSWNLRDDGLLVSFDPYQVNCYAAGPQAVIVPYAALEKVIDYNAPLASYFVR